LSEVWLLNFLQWHCFTMFYPHYTFSVYYVPLESFESPFLAKSPGRPSSCQRYSPVPQCRQSVSVGVVAISGDDWKMGPWLFLSEDWWKNSSNSDLSSLISHLIRWDLISRTLDFIS
jgi:hypothetical protein